MTNTGLYSYLTAFVAFAILSILLIISSRGTSLGRRLIIACLATTLWGVAQALILVIDLPATVVQALELARTICWCYFLLGTIDSEREESATRIFPRWLWWTLVGVLALNILVWPLMAANISAIGNLPRVEPLLLEIRLISWVALAIIGLLLTEQVIRNLNSDQRWAMKYLCLGIGVVFAYDFFVYSNALLFKAINPELWSARGFVNALAVPLIAVSVARNSKLDIGIHVSRDAVFHSVTLIGAGAYLMAMAGMGYYIRLYGGEWGSLLQVVFLVGAGVMLAILLFSDNIRKKTRVLLSKHFYSFKYDYREEWLRFTKNLSNTTETVLDRICHSLAEIVQSPAGLLWSRNEQSTYVLANCWNMAEPEGREAKNSTELHSLERFLDETFWVIDLLEYRETPDNYPNLKLPDWMLNIPGAWLLVPLIIEQRVLGFTLLKQSSLGTSLNWEDHDLLKMAGQQAAILLAQYQSEQALIEARQFEAFNRLSAYTMHDLKNILAQQSLIISNAEKHKHKPAFIDDVLTTVSNSVDRMTRLLEQMKRGERANRVTAINLNKLLAETITQHSKRKPVPLLDAPSEPVTTHADQEKLTTVFGHLIQNAQEATPEPGQVTVKLRQEAQLCTIEIQDTGTGMDPLFIRDRLFKPFDSTKGLTGMGIGAYESRNYIHSLGGNIQVESSLGKGSLFRITLPC
ncbi:MAG: PEP-CTERM system histidine kinase PrsK [Gammaproteobacteria bacterium]|nr:PEP-CTERM system histidine kinase PrsK [Gammaproteobacteria bacterium]NHN36743.1 PEP-CTERM system histidine kinase PrsK [Pseudomaricurvus alcaniphilus]